MMAKRAAPSTIPAAIIIEVRRLPALSGWRAIASIVDLPILPMPMAAAMAAMAAPRAAPAFPRAAPAAAWRMIVLKIIISKF